MPIRYAAEPAPSDAVSELGESPLWDDDTGIRWLDVDRRRLHTLDLDGQQLAVTLSTRVTAIELTTERGLLAVIDEGFGVLEPTTGNVEVFADVPRATGVSMNDGAIDPVGRCWAGSAVRDDSKRGMLYRLDGTTITEQAQHIGMSNGIDWSPDGQTMYHVDTAAGTVASYEYDSTCGELGAGRVLRSVPVDVGLPDGLTVDIEGNVWVALWGVGQVWCLDPDSGQTTAIIDVPAPCTTSCTFGGPELTTVYITTAQPPAGGRLYTVDLPISGQPPRRFGSVT